jgi:hypothetical protein
MKTYAKNRTQVGFAAAGTVRVSLYGAAALLSQAASHYEVPSGPCRVGDRMGEVADRVRA